MQEINVIKFKTEGILNSYRIPFFRMYHKTFLSPPKTNIVGMISNICGKSEEWYYTALKEDYFKVAVVIDGIQGKCKDLWKFKTVKKSAPKDGSELEARGGSIVRREKLYKSSYTVYIHGTDEDMNKMVMEALKHPRSVPSLGMDDEIIRIYSVEGKTLKRSTKNTINSVFIDEGIKYRVRFTKYQDIELPIKNVVPLKYSVQFTKHGRTLRKVLQEGKQVEYLNCEIEMPYDSEIYEDENNRVVFC